MKKMVRFNIIVRVIMQENQNDKQYNPYTNHSNNYYQADEIIPNNQTPNKRKKKDIWGYICFRNFYFINS